MRQSILQIEGRLSQISTDLRDRMAEMRKLRLAVKRAEASFGGNARITHRRAVPRVIPPSTELVRP
jgi:hypothetical protein